MSCSSRSPLRLAVVGLAVSVLSLGPASGCRRPRTPEVPEVWDEDAAPERTEALGALAPPWPAPARARLDDGLLTYWLHEPQTPTVHVRLMFATAQTPNGAVEVAAEHLVAQLRRKLARREIVVDTTHRPGRLEVALHGADDDTAVILTTLALILSNTDPGPQLVAARDRLRKSLAPATTEELATTALIAELLPAVGSERIDPRSLASSSAEELVAAWRRFADPRRAVLVVHAAIQASDARTSLALLSQRWTGPSAASRRDRGADNPLARLRRAGGQPAGPPRFLLGGTPAPVKVVDGGGTGGPVLVLGRRIPTPRHTDRSYARLAQRLAQEELDARLTVAGDQAVLVVVVPLTGRQADEAAAKTVEELSKLSAARQPRQRLFQAAQLWLGARVVEASLAGEDWTALWSESLDLASTEREISAALATDAEHMLSVDPGGLTKWQQQWLDPRSGQPGWAWVVAGADPKVQQQLARLAQLVR